MQAAAAARAVASMQTAKAANEAASIQAAAAARAVASMQTAKAANEAANQPTTNAATVARVNAANAAAIAARAAAEAAARAAIIKRPILITSYNDVVSNVPSPNNKMTIDIRPIILKNNAKLAIELKQMAKSIQKDTQIITTLQNADFNEIIISIIPRPEIPPRTEHEQRLFAYSNYIRSVIYKQLIVTILQFFQSFTLKFDSDKKVPYVAYMMSLQTLINNLNTAISNNYKLLAPFLTVIA
jgi:hypothetical protein